MLRELHIQNLAVIQDATVEFHPGLNCFTGQTGAGKSLVIGALEILLALRQPTDMLRKGAAEGRVTGVFHLTSENLRQEIAAATDLPLEAEPELIIARRLFESGRTSASINGSPITGAMLKQVGEILVDVHGQHDAQFLLKPANQLAVIDEFGGSTALRAQFAELFHRRQSLLSEQKQLAASRTLRKQQLDLFEFQAREIDEAQLVPGEYDQLTSRSKVLSNLEKIKRSASAAFAALYEDDGATIERLKGIMSLLLELSELDESLAPIASQVKEATLNLDDAALSLSRYTNRLDLDPAELAEITERLNLLNRLIDKYTGRGTGLGLDEVLAYRRQIGAEIETLRSQDQDYSTIADQINALDKELRAVGAALTKARQKAAAKLIPLVHAQLADLGMKEAKFSVEFQALTLTAVPDEEKALRHKGTKAQRPAGSSPDAPAPLSASVPECLSALSLNDFSTSSGLESAEFLIAPNPGQPARPLRRIASGGELSRIMLALKSILAQADRVSVLVFDEIDANVGGRMGTIIGEKLRLLAAVHQVLCITHLPQIAAFADRHLTIRKKSDGKDTLTTVTLMDGAPRLHELAEMISGKDVSPTSLAQAQELLEVAAPVAKTKRPARK